jgi:hypothetical protein
LHDAWRSVALLACTPGNYEQVATYVRRTVATQEARCPLPRLLGRSVLAVLAAVPVWLAYLVIFSWRAARGRVLPALFELGTEVDE